MGQRKKSVRLLTAAIRKAEHHPARFEHARALLDRALVNPPTADEDTRRGFEILKELSCVIPAAEMAHFPEYADSP